MGRAHVHWALILIVLLAAPSLLPSTSLPPLPELKTTNLFPGVVEQVQQPYQSARDHPMDAAANGMLAMALDTYQ
jgi:hypothetical protein